MKGNKAFNFLFRQALLERILSKASTTDNPFPSAALTPLRILIVLAKGEDYLKTTYSMIASTGGVSTKTIQRGLQALEEWQKRTEIQLLDIKQAHRRETEFTFHIFDKKVKKTRPDKVSTDE